MKKLLDFFVRQHLFGNLLTVIVIGVGLFTAFQIRREVFPNVSFDVITVTTVYPGASAEEVEKLITNPIEQDLAEIDGIKKILSTSIEGRSVVVIYLDSDQTTEEEAKSDIQDVVDGVTDLPEDAKDPVVAAIKSKLQPIVEVTVGGEIPPLELRKTAKNLEQEIERIPGVARVVFRGLRELEIRVEADIQKLARARLSLDDLVLALKRQNLAIPGGTVEVIPTAPGAKEKLVRTKGDFTTLEDIKKTVIRANDLGQALTIADVALVSYDLERATVLNRTNGVPSISLTILKKQQADAIELVDAVQARMDQVKESLGPDSKIKIEFVNDLSQFIRRRLNILTSNLGIGLGFVLLMLPLMIPTRFALLIALGEPFAFLGAIALLYYTGNTINLVSMMGLIIVSGILVDDSIVVTENAVRLVEEGMDPKDAAVKGTLQIIAPVTASVLCTSMAFLPMAFMSGIFGKIIFQVPLAVLTCLATSLLETFFILPAHIAHWIKFKTIEAERPAKSDGRIRKILKFTRTTWDDKVVPFYLSWLKVAIRHRYAVAGLLVVVLIGSGVLAAKGMRFVLFPPEGVEIFFIRTETPTATSLERHALLLADVEKSVAKLSKQEVINFTTTAGIQQQDPNDPTTRRGAEYGQITVFLTPENERTRTAPEIIAGLREKIGHPAEFEKITFNRLNPGPPSGKPVSVGVRARTYEEINQAVTRIKSVLAGISGVTDITDNYRLGKEELQVKVNAAETAAAKLSVASIGNTVRAAYEGLVATSVREIDQEVDVRVSLSESDRHQASSLSSLMIPNPFGNLIPLSRVARVEKAQGLGIYEHEANRRQVKVTAEVDTHVTSALAVNDQIRGLLPSLQKEFPGVTLGFGGEDEDTQESLTSLRRAFVLAVLGIYLVLVLTFKSLIQPMVILLTVPLGIIAVIWAFFFHGLPISFMGTLGVVALSGVIVNNAVIFVDFVNQARAGGMGKRESLLKAAEMRVRPIFLTTVTTVIGILPTAYGIGGLDKFVVPIAMSLGWGLSFGSVLTAFVFPAALAILDDLTELLQRSKFRVSRH